MSVTDSFTGADNPLPTYSSNWTSGGGSMSVSSNQLISSGSAENVAYWTGTGFGPDQRSKLTITAITSGFWIGVGVRISGSAYYGYYGDADSRYVFRSQSGVITNFAFTTTAGFTVGDTVELEIIGDQLKPYLNGSVDPVLGSWTTSHIAAGAPGVIGAGTSTLTKADDWVGTALSPINFDRATESERAGTTDPHSFTHTPGVAPNGVVVTVIHGLQATAFVNSITYGGVTLALVIGASDTATEPGRAAVWFKGTGLPTGAQTVSADLTSATGEDIQFVCLTLYTDDGSDIEAIDSDSITADVANPSRTLQYGGRTALAVGALYGGGSAPTAFTPNANCTTVAEFDLGAYYAEVIRQTTPGSADFTIGGTAALDDVAFAVAAFAKVTSAAKLIDAAPGSYSVTGAAAILARGLFLTSESGAYDLAGPELIGRAGRAVLADPGAYALTGLPADLLRAALLQAGAGAYALTGLPAGLGRGYLVDLGPGAYLTAGPEAVLVAGRAVLADPGAYLVTGAQALTVRAVLLELAPGSYILAGLPAELLRGYAFSALAGGYALTGEVAGSVAGRLFDAGAGSYLTAGAELEAPIGRLLVLDSGAYSIGGVPAQAQIGRVFLASPGAYEVTGSDTEYFLARALLTQPGVYELTGAEAALLYLQPGQLALVAGPGAYEVTGTESGLLAARRLEVQPGAHLLTGIPAGAVAGRLVRADPGAYLTAGAETAHDILRALGLEPGTYLVTGPQAELVYRALQTVADGWVFSEEVLTQAVLLAGSLTLDALGGDVLARPEVQAEAVTRPGADDDELVMPAISEEVLT